MPRDRSRKNGKPPPGKSLTWWDVVKWIATLPLLSVDGNVITPTTVVFIGAPLLWFFGWETTGWICVWGFTFGGFWAASRLRDEKNPFFPSKPHKKGDKDKSDRR